MRKMTLGVVFGSRSCEHEVSVISALQMMKAANPDHYDIVPIYISMKGEWYTGAPLLDLQTYRNFDGFQKGIYRVWLDSTAASGVLMTLDPPKGLFGKETQRVVARLDCAMPVLHGMHGEDGTLQGLFEMYNIPYASSGVPASAVGMDKTYMKEFFKGCGFPVLDSCWVLRCAWEADPEAAIREIEDKLDYPVFVKPASLGSSIGVTKAKNKDDLMESLALAFSFDRKVLIEKGLENPLELNCSVLGYNEDVTASEIEMPVTGGDLLSFMDKYLQGSKNATKGMASLKRILPAPIEPALKERIQSLSVDIFKRMDCKSVVRIDFMYDAATDGLYITEINTIPGSLAFYLWEASRLKYPELIDRMVACAMKAHEEKNDSNYAFSSNILNEVSFGAKSGGKLGPKHQ
ncbi:MAG TPA: D-alanine--D-alanine ligase family protein [Candidatus Limiplasma sp.]|nr:D-alanine--D-alanine ligase family protein [Candidatus Limiplasma sp.]